MIVHNAATCIACDETVECAYDVPEVTCGCGALTISGGHEFLGRTSTKPGGWIEASRHRIGDDVLEVQMDKVKQVKQVKEKEAKP